MLDKNGRIVIVGGGIVGVSTAYFLTEAGYNNVAIYEAVGVAHAASGRAGGFLARDWCDHLPTKLLARRGFQLHQELSEKLGVDIGYRRLHTLSLSLQERKKKKENNRPTLVPDWVDGNVLQAEEIGDRSSTAQVHPRLLTQALLHKAEERGAKLIKQRVFGADVCDGEVVALRLADTEEVVKGDIYVLAMGPWTGLALRWFQKPAVISGHKAHSVLIRTPDSKIDDTALFLEYRTHANGKSVDPEVYPRPDGTVYICGAGENGPLPEDPAEVKSSPEACHNLLDVAKQVSDQLANVKEVEHSACYMPGADDDRPLVGKVPGLTGLYVAAGHYCWGILQGPSTGEALAQLIISGHTPDSIRNLDPVRLLS